MKRLWYPPRYIAWYRLLYLTFAIMLVWLFLTVATYRMTIFYDIWFALTALSAFILLFAAVILPIYYRQIQYGIEEDYVYSIQGILFVSRRQVPLSAIRTVRIIRGPLERLHGVSTVILSAGGKKLVLDGISHEQALAFLRCIT